MSCSEVSVYSLPHISPDRNCTRAFPPFPAERISHHGCAKANVHPLLLHHEILLQALSGPWQREQEGLEQLPTHLAALLKLSRSPFPSHRCIIVRKMQPPQSGASPHLMLIFHTISTLHTSTNTAFNAWFSLIPMRDITCLHPEIIWHIITNYNFSLSPGKCILYLPCHQDS